MASYNSGVLYNSKKNSYNSADFYIVEVTDSAKFEEIISNIATLGLLDSGIGIDTLNTGININVHDNAIGNDAIAFNIALLLNDNASGNDAIGIIAHMAINDSGSGIDSIKDKKYSADIYFVVDSESILQPLGIMVLGDSRKDLLPPTRDMTEEIPGRHGEIDFGTEFKARPLELHVATIEGLSPLEKEELRRKIAMYLNPTIGTKKLVFLDDPDKEYNVKYSGKITPNNQPTWFDFTIPFKMCDPLIYDGNETVLVGSGTLNNNGTYETGIIVEIAGHYTNPSITIGSDTLAYTGTIPEGQKLIIDTDLMTAKLNGTNALANYNGKFPKVKPGQTSVTAGSNVTIKLKNKWL